METKLPERVLVCPLDWGLGHATRCVPVIRALLEEGWQVVVAADGAPLAFLREELGDQAAYRRFPGKAIRYPSHGCLALKILFSLPALFLSVIREHRQLKTLIRETGARMVISDNRYGLWNKKVVSVFITHQLFIKAPGLLKWTEPLLRALVRFFIRRYDQCWVPDVEAEPGLSGELSHGKGFQNIRYIGPLSRFTGIPGSSLENPLPEGFPGDFFLVLLSGPEPQRTFLEEALSRAFEQTEWPVVFVLGQPGSSRKKSSRNRLTMSHGSTSQLAWLIRHARMVVCRPGYSSLMDLAVFGKKALLIPTPGQTEQEYLGRLLQKQGHAYCVDQGKLDLQKDIKRAERYSGIPESAAGEFKGDSLFGTLMKKHQ